MEKNLAIKNGYIRKETNHRTGLTCDFKCVGVQEENLVGWFSNKYNPSFGWYLFKPSDFIQTEFGMDVFRTYSEKLDAWSLIKINPEKGTYAFINNKAYEDEGIIAYDRFSRYLKLVIEPTDTALEMFGIK